MLFAKAANKKLKILAFKPKFTYNDLLGRPVDPVSINVLINTDLEIIKLFKYDAGFSWGQSIVISSLVIRGLLSLVKFALQKFKFKRIDERVYAKKGLSELFVNDLNTDIKFYNLKESEAQRLRQYYSPNTLLGNILNSYLLINWFRALNHLTFHENQFPGIDTEAFWFSDHLMKFDDTGLLGILVFPINYYLIATSRHPFLIHINRPENRIIRLNYSFMMALTSYFFPVCYVASYLTIGCAHLVLNWLYFSYQRRKEARVYKKYAVQDHDIERIKSLCLRKEQ